MKIVHTFSNFLVALFFMGLSHAHAATQPSLESHHASPVVVAQSQSSETNTANVSTKKVNLNTADAKTLEHVIKGIGKRRAEAIVEFREKYGSFKSIDDLVKIRQFSPKFVEKNHKELEEKFTVEEAKA